jgi:hypothetical protein
VITASLQTEGNVSTDSTVFELSDSSSEGDCSDDSDGGVPL